MRKFTILFAATCLMISLPYGEVSAQKFLKKLGDAVDKGLNAVDKGLDAVDKVLDETIGTSSSINSTTNSDGVVISSFSKDVELRLLSCVRDGNLVTIVYTLTNKGPQLDMYSIGTNRTIINPDHFTQIYDSAGNNYEPYALSFGKETGLNVVNGSRAMVSGVVPTGVTVRGSIEIKPVDAFATQFAIVNLAFRQNISSGETINNEFSFKNVPIRDFEDIYARSTVLVKKMNPVVSGLDESFKVVAVTVGNDNTRVDISYTNNRNSLQYLWVSEPANNYIEYEGKRYRLLTAAQITYRRNETSVDRGRSHTYTLIFEPIPADAAKFKLYTDGGSYSEVWMVDPKGLNIARTTGVMTLNDGVSQHDNLPRLTPADRAALKVDRIKHPDFKTSWTNSQLAKGKTIYEGKEGKLQTILFVNPDQYVGEYLVSYDTAGNIIDCIQIGNLHVWGGDRGQGVFEGNKIFVSSEYSDGGTYIDYTITPDLKFRKDKERSEGS